MKYRKKPIEIEVFQYTGNLEVYCESEIPKWIYDALVLGILSLVPSYSLGKTDLVIQTLDGSVCVNEGDYIIKGIQGELYPCRKDIFEMNYEEVK